jgi:hypothetical protein
MAEKVETKDREVVEELGTHTPILDPTQRGPANARYVCSACGKSIKVSVEDGEQKLRHA